MLRREAMTLGARCASCCRSSTMTRIRCAQSMRALYFPFGAKAARAPSSPNTLLPRPLSPPPPEISSGGGGKRRTSSSIREAGSGCRSRAAQGAKTTVLHLNWRRTLPVVGRGRLCCVPSSMVLVQVEEKDERLRVTDGEKKERIRLTLLLNLS